MSISQNSTGNFIFSPSICLLSPPGLRLVGTTCILLDPSAKYFLCAFMAVCSRTLVVAVSHNFWNNYFIECSVSYRHWLLTPHSSYLAGRGCKWLTTAAVCSLVSTHDDLLLAFSLWHHWCFTTFIPLFSCMHTGHTACPVLPAPDPHAL